MAVLRLVAGDEQGRPLDAVFAGGVASSLEDRFGEAVAQVVAACPDGALRIERLAYVSSDRKDHCFDNADVFL